MLKKVVLIGALSMVSTAATATECPELWQQINDRMHNANLSEADQATLNDLRRQGEESHHAGDHAKAIEALKEALAGLS